MQSTSGGGQIFVVGADGRVSGLESNEFTTIIASGVATLAEAGSDLVAGFENGTIGLLNGAGKLLMNDQTGFTDQPSALDVLQNANSLDVYATQIGSNVPVIVSFPFIPVLTELPTSGQVAQPTSLPGADLVLVATLLSGGLVETLPANPTNVLPRQDLLALALPAIQRGEGEDVADDSLASTMERPPLPGWESYALGAAEALRQRLERQQMNDFVDDMLDGIGGFLDNFTYLFKSEKLFHDSTKTEEVPDTASPASVLPDDLPDQQIQKDAMWSAFEAPDTGN